MTLSRRRRQPPPRRARSTALVTRAANEVRPGQLIARAVF